MRILNIYEPAKSLVSADGQGINDITSLVDALNNAGASINRYNLEDAKDKFEENKIVKRLIEENGEDVLPITMMNKEVVITRRYPTEVEFYEILFPDSDLDGMDDFGDEGCGCGEGTCSCS